jgi:hypothetical protein
MEIAASRLFMAPGAAGHRFFFAFFFFFFFFFFPRQSALTCSSRST